MTKRTPGADPTPLQLWRRALLFLLGAIALVALAPFLPRVWMYLTIGLIVLVVFLAWWVSPARRGLHTPWLTALERRAPGHAIIIWSPVDPGSAQIGIGLQPDDHRLTWVNYLHDNEAWAFAKQHGGFDALPVAIVGDTIIRNATSGAVVDALKSESAPEAPHA